MEENFYGPPEIEVPEIEKICVLGDGSFGTVYKGRCRSKDVAVKVLHKQDLDEKTLTTFRQEVSIVNKIFHPNIVLFMGACTVPGQMMIVTELMPKGDLENIIQDKSIHLSLFSRIRMAKDAALGMTWLHESNPQFIHRDLKTSNLLVDENNRIKICDFGLSQIKRHGESLRDGAEGAKGTPLWMAPEVMMGRPFDEKADVYSFGVILWEIVTRCEPFKEFDNFENFRNAVCFQNTRPKIPDDTHNSIKNLIECCWQSNPIKRPPFHEIVKALELIMVEITVDDPIGCQIWKERFLDKEWVSWSTFLDTFYDVIYFYGEPSFPLLSEKPSLEELLGALDFQIGEFGSRSDANKALIQSIVEKRAHYNRTLTIADYKEKSLKILMAEKSKGEAQDVSEDIVKLERFGQTLAWFGPLIDPKTNKVKLLSTIYDILSQPWFHGDITQIEAENRLSQRPVGTFLIRYSSIVGCVTISRICSNGVITHQRIPRQQGLYCINAKVYESLQSLITNAAPELGLEQACPGSRYFHNLFQDSVQSAYIS